MIRFKKIHKKVLIYIASLYCFIALALRSVFLPPGARFPPAISRFSDEIYTISAFWEDRPLPTQSNFVRILTLARIRKKQLPGARKDDLQPKDYLRNPFDVSCSLLYVKPSQESKESQELVKITGNVTAKIYDESLATHYAGTYINCFPVWSSPAQEVEYHDRVPSHVLLETTGGGNSTVLEVTGLKKAMRETDLKHEKKGNIAQELTSNDVEVKSSASGGKMKAVGGRANRTAVCVRAMFNNYDNIRQLGQFIAYYWRVLGVTSFNFYLLSASPRVNQFLEEVQAEQSQLQLDFRVVRWNLDEKLENQYMLWDYGAISVISDCLYRSMQENMYAYIVDLDEFIVPREELDKADTDTFIRSIEQLRKPPIGRRNDAFLFRNTFYCSEFNPKVDYEKKFDIFPAGMRGEDIWSFQLRAKMLVKPREIVVIGHHKVHEFVNSTVSYATSVPNQIAILQHYRSCQGINLGFQGVGEPVLSRPMTFDNNIYQYRESVISSPVYAILKKYLTD